MDITVDAVLAMAPDEASVKAARGLASPGKWQTLGFDDAAAWGLCQGSGSKPYQVRVDFSGPACSCSCPSSLNCSQPERNSSGRPPTREGSPRNGPA